MSEAANLGTLLLEQGLVTKAALDAALSQQPVSDKPLGRILIENGAITEIDLMRTLAQQVGLDFVDLNDYSIDASVVSRIPEALARRYQALPVRFENDELVVVMSDPSNVFAMDDIRAITGSSIRTVVATSEQIADAIERFYRLDTDVESMAQQASDEFAEGEDLMDVTAVVDDAPIVKFVNLLITQAVHDRASDIHVEPSETDLRIRFRVDGVLHEVMRSPKSIQAGVTSRLKIMAELNISERRLPQDGRISVNVGDQAIDLRLATLPTVYGEKLVMRILDKTQALLSLDDLGFLPEPKERYERAVNRPNGTILVTGPTGSGKSTTLYATLNQLNVPDRNLITVEDPVEYRLAGINQINVNPKAGLTFASALRSILRSDPDVLLVGEIRDRETATIAAEASITGHMVLSTLHTNDSSSTPMRLVEMGVEPFLVVSAIDCVLAQRLARRLCEHCKEEYQPSEPELVEAGWPTEALSEHDWPTLFRPAGCESCSRTGYRGRFALFEVLLFDEEIERLIIERRTSDDIKKVAMMRGMLTLRDDGLRKVALGRTSLEEVFRVVA
ncbi:MAG: ATPase, T2SS/T4P/T4SS family [Acidimicrobiia bacterium]|nr:ATPase, T2SS/T4P/T4SS family [Acidimicrobiia bacterium]